MMRPTCKDGPLSPLILTPSLKRERDLKAYNSAQDDRINTIPCEICYLCPDTEDNSFYLCERCPSNGIHRTCLDRDLVEDEPFYCRTCRQVNFSNGETVNLAANLALSSSRKIPTQASSYPKEEETNI
jgi:hypothetical protein